MTLGEAMFGVVLVIVFGAWVWAPWLLLVIKALKAGKTEDK